MKLSHLVPLLCMQASAASQPFLKGSVDNESAIDLVKQPTNPLTNQLTSQQIPIGPGAIRNGPETCPSGEWLFTVSLLVGVNPEGVGWTLFDDCSGDILATQIQGEFTNEDAATQYITTLCVGISKWYMVFFDESHTTQLDMTIGPFDILRGYLLPEQLPFLHTSPFGYWCEDREEGEELPVPTIEIAMVN